MRNILIALVVICFTQQSFAQFKTVFNEPGFSGVKTSTIENHIIQLIRSAKPGSNIRIGLYDFDRLPLAQALVAASKRGVNVYAIFDGQLQKPSKKDGTPVNLIREELSCSSSSCVKYCLGVATGGCRGWMNNHNKFVLFSELSDGRKNISVLTSANWTDGQRRNANDLLQIENDKALYDGLVKYWNDLWSRKTNSPLLVQGTTAKVHTFPNHQYDPVVDVLKRVSCQLPGSLIRLSESRFNNGRRKIAERLVQLSKEGCDVKVLGRDEPDHDSPGDDIKAMLGKNLIIIPEDSPNSHHSKMVLIHASMNGSRSKRSVVLAGSHNLNNNSLKNNDELLAEVDDAKVLQNYLAYWNRVVKAAVDAGIISTQ
jgi:phosphatidylserine/phosphatidylglycerophosphate/cardiolipin synthase-like enzyme